MRKLLAVRTDRTNYVSYYQVTYAASFQEAAEKILRAEAEGCPFDELDIPASDEQKLWEFLDWMERRGRKYPFSVYGCNTFTFIRLRDKCRARGFHFNT